MTILIVTFFQTLLMRRPDFESVIEFGDMSLKTINLMLGSFINDFDIPKGISKHVYDLEFPSPITVAAFKGDPEILAIWLRLGLGGVCLKTVLPNSYSGNPRPRIVELRKEGALVNAMGLPGPGVKQLLEQVKASNLSRFNRPIGYSIGGQDLEDYKRCFDPLVDPDYIEINISCPNTKEGQLMSENIELLNTLLTYIRQKSSVPISIKLSPDQSNEVLCNTAEMAVSHNKIILNAGNTHAVKCDRLSIGKGGLSGQPLFERTCEMVQLLSPFGLPIIATGGISTIDHVTKVINDGASLVGMATAIVQNQYCIPKLNYELAQA